VGSGDCARRDGGQQSALCRKDTAQYGLDGDGTAGGEWGDGSVRSRATTGASGYMA
jgi:hypothetical protein